MQKDLTVFNECVDKLLTSPIFVKYHRQQGLLRYLIKETLAGKAHRLNGYTLGFEVFKRGVDFDPSIDAIVRVEIGRLRAKLVEYYNSYGLTDAILLVLPKGRVS